MKLWRSALVIAAVTPLIGLLGPASAHSTAVKITSINGARTRPGGVKVSSSALTLKGTAALPKGAVSASQLVVDAGDSQYVKPGDVVALKGTVSGGSGQYDYNWTSSAGGAFAKANESNIEWDTKGVATGPVTLTLEVTDKQTKATAKDTVKELLYSSSPLISAKQATTIGLPDDVVAGGAVDQQSKSYPFTIAAGSKRLDVTLDWGNADNDYDVYVDDPSGLHSGDSSGATSDKRPERIGFDDPAPGKWAARVDAFTSLPDTYTLTVTAVPPAPFARVSTPGPFRFDLGAPQKLHADVAGGRGPVQTAWDLDMDGTFEAAGTDVRAQFPLGNHLVAVKATDADGYEAREVTAVRVTVAGSTRDVSPIVVIAVTDTGINPYHKEFGAADYPDQRILDATGNFTKHPSTYINGYPKDAPALPVTLGKGYLPKEDANLWTRQRIALSKLYWIPGTKIIGALDMTDSAAVNAGADTHPILDDDGHGTKCAAVALGNTVGYCPACLLAFFEGLGQTPAYGYKWVDFTSNSFGPVVPTPPGAFTPPTPKAAVERGQITLFAAGNGTGNAFVAPNDTLLNNDAGPDWVVRVGAADSRTRKPIIMDGNTADLSSFGSGPIPAADVKSDSSYSDHSGTSAATPITTGVFGQVLGAVREVLGDEQSGQKGLGQVAVGRPVAASPYLNDGVLTRDELWDAVLKTAEPDTSAAFHQGLQDNEAPYTPYHYAFEGYGVADGESAVRAVDVLLGRRPMPDRSDVDSFLAADSDRRIQAWGSWNGRKPAKAPKVSAPFAPPSSSATGAPPLSFTSPASGTSVDPVKTPKVSVTGRAEVTSGRLPGTDKRRFFLRRSGCNATTAPDPTAHTYLSTQDGPDPGNGCSLALQATAATGVATFSDDFPAENGLPLALDPARPVSGTVYIDGTGASPNHTITISLESVARVIGRQTVSGTVVNVWRSTPPVRGPNKPVAFPYSFKIDPKFGNVDLKQVSVRVTIEQSGGLFSVNMDDPASFVDVPLAGAPVPSAAVQLAVDDATFKTPVTATIRRDGTWGANVDVAPLQDGAHSIIARIVQGTATGPAQTLSFGVSRSGRSLVQVQLVPRGSEPRADGWVDATDTSKRHTFSTWTARLSGAPHGTSHVYARLLAGGGEIARFGPVIVRR